ncbi:protein CHUP1, chloroplastic-like [Rutidosis leptorrhynchoides]|uniref:protein CHUP1, chloroplastic-like n=1 Tax=Rutidosis leptorrhynchoides TaxID=125765 RepID=UPI003A98E6BB
MGRGKKDIQPVVLKIGLALVFSISGMIFTFIKNKSIKPPQSSDTSNQGSSRRGAKSENQASHRTPNTCLFDPLATGKDESPNSMLDLSLSPKTDENLYLLPEFGDLVKEFDITAMKVNLDRRISEPESESPAKGNECEIKEKHEQEIKNLTNMVKILKERETNLEIQLLAYYGLQEQETTVKELQNRLKLNNMEAKLLSLKVESLKNDNKRLEAQLTGYNKVVADLEAAQGKIKDLKKKLRLETAQNKERSLDLQQRVQKMQEYEHKSEVGIESEIRSSLRKLLDMETEADELRKLNHSLQVEKSKLTQRLEHVQNLATSVSRDESMVKLKEERECLRQQNEDLTRVIDQLQADRCSDVEELVYLRWINACLRYELRNQQPDPGKTTARDLSKTLSPRSEQKAKQLILEYANKQSLPELDDDQWSGPQSSSNLTDSSEPDESLTDYSSHHHHHHQPHHSNHKFFGKLMKFLRGKDGHNRNSSVEQTESVEDVNSCSESSFGNLVLSSKHSFDSQKLIYRLSDVGVHRRIDSIAEDGNIDKRSELVKYAEVLKDSSPKPTAKDRRRSMSLS